MFTLTLVSVLALQARSYLNKLPDRFSEDDLVLITDPMLATGGTMMQVGRQAVSWLGSCSAPTFAKTAAVSACNPAAGICMVPANITCAASTGFLGPDCHVSAWTVELEQFPQSGACSPHTVGHHSWGNV